MFQELHGRQCYPFLSLYVMSYPSRLTEQWIVCPGVNSPCCPVQQLLLSRYVGTIPPIYGETFLKPLKTGPISPPFQLIILVAVVWIFDVCFISILADPAGSKWLTPATRRHSTGLYGVGPQRLRVNCSFVGVNSHIRYGPAIKSMTNGVHFQENVLPLVWNLALSGFPWLLTSVIQLTIILRIE